MTFPIIFNFIFRFDTGIKIKEIKRKKVQLLTLDVSAFKIPRRLLLEMKNCIILLNENDYPDSESIRSRVRV